MSEASYFFTLLFGFTFKQYYFARNGRMEEEEGNTLMT